MLITRIHLIDLCNQFLEGKIDKNVILDFAWSSITADDDCEDDVVTDTIFDWDMEDMNYDINHINMELWKHRLETGIDLLPEHNVWNVHIERQKEICEAYKSKWVPTNKKHIIGVSKDLNNNPIHGLRHPIENGNAGWYLWTGEYSESEDFFKPICAEHLLQMRPDVIKFLGLDISFRFLSDNAGYQDVWQDDRLRDI